MYADKMCGVNRIPPGDDVSPPGAARFLDVGEASAAEDGIDEGEGAAEALRASHMQ